MTKLQQAQQRAVMMASALVTILHGQAAAAGPRDWLKKMGEAVELYKQGLTFTGHWKNHFSSAGLHDFFGRNVFHSTFIGLTAMGLIFIALKDRKKSPKGWFSGGVIAGYLLVVLLGFFYEGLRSFPTTATFAYLLMLGSLGIGCWGIYCQKQCFSEGFTALREGKFMSFLRYCQLDIPMPAEGPASDLEEEDEEDEEEEEEDGDTGETEPQSASIACPNCGQQTPNDGVCCEHCGASLSAETVSSVVCPNCGHQTPNDGVCCEHCGGALVAEAGGHKPRARKRRKRGSYDPWS